MSEALRLADALGIVSVGGPLTVTMHEAASELRRLHAELERKSDAIQRLWKERDELRALNAELVEALRWIDMRCPAILLDHPLHRGLHMEAAYDAGACARAALAKVEANK